MVGTVQREDAPLRPTPPPPSERLEQAGQVASFLAIIITSAMFFCKFFSFHISCTQSEMNDLLKIRGDFQENVIPVTIKKQICYPRNTTKSTFLKEMCQ